METTISEEVVLTPRNLRWSSIWGGLFVAAGVQLLMQLLGQAVGLSWLSRSGGTNGLAVWTIAWAVVSIWVAFFCGGWFAAGAGDTPLRRAEVARYGVLVWGFTLTIGFLLAVAGPMSFSGTGPGRHWLAIGGAIAPQAPFAAWVSFGATLLALFATLGGAMVAGRPHGRRRTRRDERRATSTTIVGATPTPTTP